MQHCGFFFFLDGENQAFFLEMKTFALKVFEASFDLFSQLMWGSFLYF